MLQSVTQWKTKAASRSSITTGVLDARFVSTLRVAISTNPPSCCCRCIQAKTRCQPLSLASAFASLLSCMFFSLLSAFGRCLVTRKHGLHPAKPALQVALLECLQHSSGKKAHCVCQSRINRPRTQIVDGVAEQFANVVHAFEWASDIFGGAAGRSRCTLGPAT